MKEIWFPYGREKMKGEFDERELKAVLTSSKETANNDVAHSNDKALLSAISESTNKNRGIKMK